MPNKENEDQIREEVRREIEEEKLRTKIRREIEIEDKYKEERIRYESRGKLFHAIHITIAAVGLIVLIWGLVVCAIGLAYFLFSFIHPQITMIESIESLCVGAIMVPVGIVLLIVYWLMSRVKT